MRIKRSRISRLRSAYKGRAQSARLRLTDRTIRRLERERIHKRTSFEKVWKAHRRKRIRDIERRLAKRSKISKTDAHKLRQYAIKKGLTYQEAFEELFRKCIPTDFISFYNVLLDRIKSNPDVPLMFHSTPFDWWGKIGQISPAEIKHAVEDYFNKKFPAPPGGNENYWVLFDDLVCVRDEWDKKGNLIKMKVWMNDESEHDVSEFAGKENDE